jgi:hypothetical protein
MDCLIPCCVGTVIGCALSAGIKYILKKKKKNKHAVYMSQGGDFEEEEYGRYGRRYENSGFCGMHY